MFIFYERLVDFFKDLLMVVFKCIGNLKDMVIRVILDNLFFNVGFKICLFIWCFLCMYSVNIDSFIRFVLVVFIKYCVKCYVFV